MAKLTAQEALGRTIGWTVMLGYVSFEVVSQVIIHVHAENLAPNLAFGSHAEKGAMRQNDSHPR